MTQNEEKLINQRLDVLATRPFRSKFHLKGKERTIVEQKGLGVMRRHAAELLSTRLFMAQPVNDGKQTPYKGHPVFVAQHATATCCRGCLGRWHNISKNRELKPREQEYVLKVIETWMVREAGNSHDNL